MLYIIIQARMTSTRLPGKVMLPLCGKSILEIMLDRLHSFKEQIIIATTDDGTEAPITQLCDTIGVRYYKGDTENVLSRYYETAVYYGASEEDTIIRLTSDCPLIDPDLVKNLIDFFVCNDYEYATLDIEESYPVGLGAEIMQFEVLEKAYKNATLPYELEHVTQYINNTHRKDFHIGLLKDAANNSHYRLTLDESLDYEAILEIYRVMECKIDFKYADLLHKLEEFPHISKINKTVRQKNSIQIAKEPE